MQFRRRSSIALLSVVSTFCLAGWSQTAVGQEDGQPAKLERIALTEPPAGDANYNLLGEFVGTISLAENIYEPLGLQIRPIGNDNFEALQFLGGLPGQEGFKAESVQLIGRRSGEFLILSGGPWVVLVETDHCTLLDREGKRLGRLERIGRGSPTMGAKPPEGAVVLFDGTNTDQFLHGVMTDEGWLQAGADIKPMFQDFDMHIEFRLPYMPNSDGQQRGNSGCYLQSRYEVQVLDSFAQVPQFNGCSSLYRTKSPDLNMCFPPLVWQSYDIRFTAPRWAADRTKLRPAHITVWHNGVKTQDNVALENKTGAGQPEEPVLLPTKLQNHSDPVVFRNIWVIDRGLAPGIEFPVMGKPEDLQAELNPEIPAEPPLATPGKTPTDAPAEQAAPEPAPTPAAPTEIPPQPAPAEPAPTEPAPTEPTPVEPATAEPTPTTEPAPAAPTPPAEPAADAR